MADKVMAFNHIFQAAAVATGAGTVMDVGGLGLIGIQVEGITTATITLEGTIDGTNWEAIQGMNMADGAVATTITADGLYQIPCSGLEQVRCRISAYTTGTINVNGKGLPGAGFALPA